MTLASHMATTVGANELEQFQVGHGPASFLGDRARRQEYRHQNQSVAGSVFFISSRRRHTKLQGDLSSDVCSSDLIFFSSRRRHTRLQGDWSSDVCSSD